jgi:hypothetical protein
MRVFLVAWLPVFFVVGCGDKLECGEGTHEADSICVPDEGSDVDGSADSDDTGETDGDADGSADSDDTGETDGDADGGVDDTGTGPVDSDEDGFVLASKLSVTMELFELVESRYFRVFHKHTLDSHHSLGQGTLPVQVRLGRHKKA